MLAEARSLLAPLARSGIGLLFLGSLVAFATLAPGFFAWSNLITVARQGSMLALVTFGMTLTLIGGGIDLSVGAVLGLAAVMVGVVMRAGGGLAAALTAAVAAGAACGLVNGWLVGYLRLPPFVATFGMLGMARGLALVLTDGRVISGLAPSIRYLSEGAPLALPVPLWCVLLALLALELSLRNTAWGVSIYAIGGREEAARLAGVPVAARKLSTYAISGLLAGVAGALMAARMVSSHPTVGDFYDFDAVAAAVVGGTSIAGGRGGMLGSFAGAAYVAMLRNGMDLTGVPFAWQIVALGLIIIGAFLVELLSRRLAARGAA